MDVNFTYPTVLIENTDLVDDVSCAYNPAQSGKFMLLISTQAAFNIIKQYWTSLPQMVLIINGAACYRYTLSNPTAGGGTNNTRQYWLGKVSQMSPSFTGGNTTYLNFVGDEIALEQGITEGYLQWGECEITDDAESGADSSPGPTGNAPDNSTAPSPTATLNNTQLCSQSYVPPQGTLPAANPCSDDFDQALDQAAGVVYVPEAARHTNLALAMQGARAHPAAASLYLASVSYTAAQKRMRSVQTASPAQNRQHERSFPQVTPAPALHPRGLSWGDIADAFEEAGEYLVEGLDTLASDGKSAVNAFSADVSSFEASATAALGALATAVVSFVDNAGTAIKSGFEELAGDITAITQDLAHVIENTAEEVANVLGTFGPQGSGTININLAPDDKAESPWGLAYQIYKYTKDDKDKRDAEKSTTTTSTSSSTSRTSTSSSSSTSSSPSSNVDKSITAYCVGCGLTGTVTYSGAARFSIADGVQELTFAMQGPLQFTIGLGLDAEVVYTMPTYKVPLLPPQDLIPVLEIEGILAIGPVVELDATLDLQITAEGRAIAGTTIGIPNFSSYFDFVNTANSYVKGFDSPTVSKYFAAAGQIGATATLGMPFSIGVGIDIIPGNLFDKQIKVVNTPSITANAAFEAQFSTGSGAPSGPNVTCPNGFSWDVTYADELDLNIFGLYTDPLYSYSSPPVAGGCYQIPGTSSQDKRHLPPQEPFTTDAVGPYPSNFPVDNYNSTSAGMVSSNNVVQNASTSYASYGTQLTAYPVNGSTLSVVSEPGGNLYVQTASTGTMFQIIRDVGSDWTSAELQYAYAQSISLVTDDQNRGFYLFGDTLADYGVSRVRMYGVDQAPSNAFQTVFGQGDLSGSDVRPISGPFGAYFFSDPNNPLTAYYPVACLVTNAANEQYTQVFATSDVADAIRALTDNVSTFTAQIVGGVVHSCTYLQLNGAYTPPTNGDSAVDQANAIVQKNGLPPLFPSFSPINHQQSGGSGICFVNGQPAHCPTS